MRHRDLEERSGGAVPEGVSHFSRNSGYLISVGTLSILTGVVL